MKPRGAGTLQTDNGLTSFTESSSKVQTSCRHHRAACSQDVPTAASRISLLSFTPNPQITLSPQLFHHCGTRGLIPLSIIPPCMHPSACSPSQYPARCSAPPLPALPRGFNPLHSQHINPTSTIPGRNRSLA